MIHNLTSAAEVLEEKVVTIKDEYDIVNARLVGKELSTSAGLGIVDHSRIATAISELARNALIYAGGGKVRMRLLHQDERQGMEIIVSDSGPGIIDIELAMQDGYTSGGGLGVGLPGSQRLMDEFQIESEVGKGTTITLRKWKS